MPRSILAVASAPRILKPMSSASTNCSMIGSSAMTDGATLASGAGVAMVVCVFIWMARAYLHPTFGRWWDAEGMGLMIVLTILFFAVFSSRYWYS